MAVGNGPQRISGLAFLLRGLGKRFAPLDEETVFASVGRTGRALVVHEAQLTGGFGGELAARIADQAFDSLDAPVRRLAYPDHPVPFNKELEAECLPDEESIAASLRELAAW